MAEVVPGDTAFTMDWSVSVSDKGSIASMNESFSSLKENLQSISTAPIHIDMQPFRSYGNSKIDRVVIPVVLTILGYKLPKGALLQFTLSSSHFVSNLNAAYAKKNVDYFSSISIRINSPPHNGNFLKNQKKAIPC